MMYKVKIWRDMQFFWVLVFALTGHAALAQNIPRPAFENDRENFSNAGYVKISWAWEAGNGVEASPVFQLQRSQDPAFTNPKTIYEGQDFASFRSGLENGLYFYRVNATLPGGVTSDWSDPVQVEVQHHSMALTFTLAGLGALVFLITVIIVVQGARRTRTLSSN